ncbi:MAG: hypothetical protein PHV59_06785 [Victivallales bacterium]|nr:hypothetical protein [Victivallales bacterium]
MFSGKNNNLFSLKHIDKENHDQSIKGAGQMPCRRLTTKTKLSGQARRGFGGPSAHQKTGLPYKNGENYAIIFIGIYLDFPSDCC